MQIETWLFWMLFRIKALDLTPWMMIPYFWVKLAEKAYRLCHKAWVCLSFHWLPQVQFIRSLRVKFVHSFKRVECNRKFYLTQQNGLALTRHDCTSDQCVFNWNKFLVGYKHRTVWLTLWNLNHGQLLLLSKQYCIHTVPS